MDRSYTVRSSGLHRSKDAGMSSVKTCEKQVRRKPKVSLAMLISQGLVGPKPRTKVVGDGQQVYIPVLSLVCNGMTK